MWAGGTCQLNGHLAKCAFEHPFSGVLVSKNIIFSRSALKLALELGDGPPKTPISHPILAGSGAPASAGVTDNLLERRRTPA
jgi:hypothetical protein